MARLKKLLRPVCAALAVLLLVTLLGGCAAAESMAQNEATRGDDFTPETMDKEIAMDSTVSGATSIPEDGRKRIVTANMTVQTREFDALNAGLREKMETLGGYIEAAETRERGSGLRHAEYTLRIPPEKLAELCSALGEMGTVTAYSEAINDVTTAYIDTESNIAALEGERDALLELLDQSGSLSDVLEVRSRLTKVIAELESYEATLRSYDAQIAYSKLTLSVSEVERETQVAKLGLWGEIGSRISESVYEIGGFFRALFIWVAGNIIYLAIVAVIIAAVVVLLRRAFGGKKKQKQDPKE